MKAACVILSIGLALLVASPLYAQTMINQGDVPAEGGFRTVTLVDGFEHPWGMAWLPDGDILVTERSGGLYRVHGSPPTRTRIDGVPEVFAAGQGGLLDIRVHPRFADNQKIYVTYAHGTRRANGTRVAVAVLRNDRLMEWRVLLEATPEKTGTQHFGSRLLWLPDNTLLVSIGDGGNPPLRLGGDWIRKQAQKRTSRLGKIVRINDDGSVPRDNPFPADADTDPFVWSFGHRNIQGLAYDAMRGLVWASEHGALGGDELNVIHGGRNYGWPTVTYSREYVGGVKISPYISKPGMEDPRVVWMSAIAPSGMAIYTGKRFPQWTGDAFVGGLRSQDIRRIDLDADGAVIGESALRIGERVRDVRQGPDGLLYVLTDEARGRLLRLEPTVGDAPPETP
jgi:glucose/arabinose dehydrogenase